MNSLEFIKQHVTEWPSDNLSTVMVLNDRGYVRFYQLGGIDSGIIDLSEHFAPDYYDGKVWTREEFESHGAFKQPDVHWDNAPEWATSLGTVGIDCDPIWYNSTHYAYVDGTCVYTFNSGANFNTDGVTHIMDRPTPNEPSVDATVEERGSRYDAFKDGADIMQSLKTVMRDTPNWSSLTPSQREALEMIQHKIGRILNGDPNYTDSWHDIQGYARLVEEELNGNVL